MPVLIACRTAIHCSLLALGVLTAAPNLLHPVAAGSSLPAAPAVSTQDGAFTPAALHDGADGVLALQPAVDIQPSSEPVVAPVGAGWG